MMRRRFVIEAVTIAISGQVLVPHYPVDYLVPMSTIWELTEMYESEESIIADPAEEKHMKLQIIQLIEFFNEPLNRKKIERTLNVPWRLSAPIIINPNVTVHVVHAIDTAEFGEQYDPIETELLLLALKENAAIITDQEELVNKIIESDLPIQVFDIEDFDYALEYSDIDIPQEPN